MAPGAHDLATENEALREENTALREENEALRQEVEALSAKVTELEARLSQGSRSSSLPPSTDSPTEQGGTTGGPTRGGQGEAWWGRARPRQAARHPRRDPHGSERPRRGRRPRARALRRLREGPERPRRRGLQGPPGLRQPRSGAHLHRAPFGEEALRLRGAERRRVFLRSPCFRLLRPERPCRGLYLLHAQHCSVERTAQALAEMLGAPVSTGFVASLVPEAAGSLAPCLAEVAERLVASPVVHVDEAPDQVRTDTVWFHVAATERSTFLYASDTRGKAAPDEAGVLGRFTGTMVHDRLAMCFNYTGAAHATCGAHSATRPRGRWRTPRPGMVPRDAQAAHRDEQGLPSGTRRG